MTKYQENYSEIYVHEIDVTREKKAQKTLAVIETHSKRPMAELSVLEVGCFVGEISRILAPRFKSYVAIDIDAQAIARAKDKELPNMLFSEMNAESLTFSNDSFDLVICSHVYEHVPHPKKMMNEIYRVLKPGGFCYFAAGNRFNIMEPHYRLPFLSVVPKPIANIYLKLFRGKSPYYETHLTLSGLRRLTQSFRVVDYSKEITRHPSRFAADDLLKENSLKYRIANFLVNYLYYFFPTYIWVLEKKLEIG